MIRLAGRLNSSARLLTVRVLKLLPIGLALMFFGGACGNQTRSAPRIDVLILGDSLLYESRQIVRAGLSRSRVVVRAHPGFAPCDLLQTLDDDLARFRPRLVVLETAGGGLTPCMRGVGPLGSQRFTQRYAADVSQVIRKARSVGSRVLVVDPPPFGGLSAGANDILIRMDRGWRSDAEGRAGIRFTSMPRDAVSDHGTYVPTLPCIAEERQFPECRAGRIAIRDAYFGVHFCPMPYADARAIERGCPTYSSGAVRFGRALVEAVVDLGVLHRTEAVH